jgi:uncharacterized membrane protein YebE (DUF533 family)
MTPWAWFFTVVGIAGAISLGFMAYYGYKVYRQRKHMQDFYEGDKFTMKRPDKKDK